MLGFLRRRVFPWAVWLVAMSTAGWLWYGINIGTARGFVEGVPYTVAAPQVARIDGVFVTPGQRVTAGQVIAKLDDREISAELATLDAERIRVEAELGAVATQTQLVVADNSRSVEDSVDALELARQQARAERSVVTAELGALEDQVEAVRELVDKRMADRRELAALLVQRAALREQQSVSREIIRELDNHTVSARSRRAGVPADATESVTLPLRAELEVIRAKQAVLQVRKDALTLRAPGDGEVTAVLLRPGEIAIEGAAIATLVGGPSLGASGKPLVFACTSETDSAHVRVGEAVELSAIDGHSVTVRGRVERLAPEVVELPVRCWRDPRLPQWGRGVYISTDDPIGLLPGQGLAIKFTGELADARANDTAAAAPPVEPQTSDVVDPQPVVEQPRAIGVPAELMARTRFEPSAISWSPVRRRYIVVSDDTGLADTTEHAPWLFTMDETGRVDREPIVIDGIEGFSDLESIAPAPDGGFYLLASQSRSRKGKRPRARQLFGKVELTETTAVMRATVALAELLEAGDRLAELGVDDSDALDIEGMTASAAGGLLLGLKGPIDGSGNAIIWHMRDPDRLLETKDLAAAGLTTWGRVALSVAADGARTPAGIAELLELPDGTLLVAATAATTKEPKTQDGELLIVDGAADLATPRLLRRFSGLKPEGLALGPSGDAIAIVFDAAAATPQWMEQRWPAR